MKVLFVCKSNVGRSQIAEAFFNTLSKKHASESAGTHVGQDEGTPVHEFVVGCMADAGIDVSKNKRKPLTPRMAEEADKIIVMTEKENLPPFAKGSSKLEFWDVPDAKGTSYEFHVKIRDRIKRLVQTLIKELG